MIMYRCDRCGEILPRALLYKLTPEAELKVLCGYYDEIHLCANCELAFTKFLANAGNVGHEK